MPKKARVKVITNRDKELFKQLSRTGLITREQAQKYLNYDKNNRRLSNLVHDGYLKEELAKIGNKYQTVYRLNNLGRNYVKENIAEVDCLYKFAGVKHDYQLTKLYYEKFWDYRDTWRTETDYKQINCNGAPDGTIQIGERTIVIEVITNNYTAEQIEQKETFAEINGMEVFKYYV